MPLVSKTVASSARFCDFLFRLCGVQSSQGTGYRLRKAASSVRFCDPLFAVWEVGSVTIAVRELHAIASKKDSPRHLPARIAVLLFLIWISCVPAGFLFALTFNVGRVRLVPLVSKTVAFSARFCDFIFRVCVVQSSQGEGYRLRKAASSVRFCDSLSAVGEVGSVSLY